MSDSFHAVLNEELESVPVLVHVEVPCMNLSNDVPDIAGSIELIALFKLEYHLLQVIV